MRDNSISRHIFAFLAVLAAAAHGGAAGGAAGQEPCAWAPASGPAQGASLAIRSGDGKELSVAVPPEAAFFTETECLPWEGPDKHGAVHFRAFDKGGSVAFEAFAALGGAAPVLAWSGMTGLVGEPGERSGVFLDYEPLAPGAKTAHPILYTLDETVRLCGFGPAPLAVKLYDPKTASFRPVSFDRLRRWKRGEKKWWGTGSAQGAAPAYAKPTPLAAKAVPPAAPGGLPLPSLLVFSSSSSSSGGAAAGAAPVALGDGDRSTGWIEGSGGDGRGELVTAVTFSAQVPLTGLEIAAARGASPKEAAAFNAVRKLTVTLDGGRVFSVDVAADPRKDPGKDLLVPFPAPVTTGCVSLVIDEVWPSPPAAGNHTYVGELTARSTIEESAGLAGLLNGLEQKKLTGALEKVAGQLAPAAVPLLDAAWGSLGDGARAAVLARTGKNLLAGAATLPLVEKELAWAAGGGKDGLVAALVDNLSAAPGLLVAWTESPPSPEAGELARLALAAGGDGKAFEETVRAWIEGAPAPGKVAGAVDVTDIVARALQGPPMTRAEGAQAGAALKPDDAAGGWCGIVGGKLFAPAATDAAAPAAGDTKRLVLLHLLHESGSTACAAGLAAGMWSGTQDFETRWYLVQLGARLAAAGAAGVGPLLEEALGAPEAPLRAAALEAAALLPGDGQLARGAVLSLLGDPSPAVRGAAAAVYARLASSSPEIEEKLLAVAADDAWPEVRREALAGALRVAAIPEEKLLRYLSDPSPDARKQAVRLAVAKKARGAAVGAKLVAAAADPLMRWDVREEAALAVGALCIGGLEKDLEKVAQGGLLPDSTEAQISAATGAIGSLGMLGAAGAVETLSIAALPAMRDELRLAAIEALAAIGGPDAKKLLGELAQSADGTIRKSAAAALASLEAGKAAPACAKGK